MLSDLYWDYISLVPICYIPGVLNLLVLAYPQINVVPLCVPPNKNLIQIVPPGQKIAKETAVSSLFYVHERPENGLY